MLKVECGQCKAPYQIDERRVPPAGLKMRCPKCGHSFLVTNAGGAQAAPPAATAGAVAPRPDAARPLAATMLGVGETAGAKPAVPAPKPAGVPAAMKKTMAGVAPPGPAAPARPAPPQPAAARPAPPPPVAKAAPPPVVPERSAMPSDFPPALGRLDEVDLPDVQVGLPAPRVAAPPKAAPPAPPARNPAPAPEDIELDLPAVAADLPIARPGGAKVPSMAGKSFEIDLPVPASSGIGLPSPKRDPGKREAGVVDLPAVAAHLPAVAAHLPSVAHDPRALDVGLPVVSAGLPSVSAGLPSVSAGLPSPAASLPVASAGLPVAAASLPVTAASLPSPAAVLPVPAEVLPVSRGFGEIDLPNVTESLPSVLSPQGPPPQPARPASVSAAFGEIDLPREAAGGSAPPPRPPPPAHAGGDADFGDLEFEERPRTHRSGMTSAVRGEAARSGGMGFGEVDFGGEDAGAPVEASIGVEAPALPDPGAALPGPQAAATAPVSIRAPEAPRERPVAAPAKRSVARLVSLGLLLVLILGGAALQLTPYGAFGYLVIGDVVHAKDYVAATSSAIAGAEKTMGSDTYDDAKSAVEATAAAHARVPRAKPLTAYAAFVDALTTVRFGADTTRASRDRQLTAELAAYPDTKYLDLALAAQQAAGGELDKSVKSLDRAEGRYPGDPVLVDVALIRGDVALAAKDPATAVVAFEKALTLSNDARAHYGLARGYDALGDGVNAKKEIDATLAASPMHAGALSMRARRQSATVDDKSALKDLATVLEGPARSKASPAELSNAYASRAWIELERGAASEAREAFAQAAQLDPRNVAALNGEGKLLLDEGRYTEALARFDTALQFDAMSPQTIANDAEAKLSLERLADAKQQLSDAKAKFPKNIQILLLLGRVEQRLGNLDAAEQDLRAAMSYADPARPDAVQPYVALAELLAARGHLSDATTLLDDAKKKLPPSAALDRAVGEVSEAQGDYDAAIAQYRSALAKAPKDVRTHFLLAVVLRRVRKFDDAAAELDQVAAVDKEYPGLSLERGLLYEESGFVDKAIDQFRAALAKAPDDPDLQLRVGSAYVAIGRPDEALPMLHKVLDKRPTSAEAYHYIGRALMLQGPGEQVEALRYLRRAVDLDPNRAEFHVYVAWAANDAQPAQLELARDEIAKVLGGEGQPGLDKLNAEAYWQRGVLEFIQGALDDAIKDERQALQLKPSRYEAHATLAECYEQKNDPATALAEWSKAVSGDGNATAADGSVLHPYWRFKYGSLLADRGGPAAALAQLMPAVTAGEKLAPRPGWLPKAEFLAAESLRKSGKRAEAIEHYRRFLEIAQVNSPDRADAVHALQQLSPGSAPN